MCQPLAAPPYTSRKMMSMEEPPYGVSLKCSKLPLDKNLPLFQLRQNAVQTGQRKHGKSNAEVCQDQVEKKSLMIPASQNNLSDVLDQEPEDMDAPPFQRNPGRLSRQPAVLQSLSFL